MKTRVVALLALLGVSGSTCAADQLTPVQAHGKQAYDHICIYCHAPGVWGANSLARRMDKEHAVLENRTDLTAAGIRAVVRTGIGSMPPLRRTELSDADVDAIAAYLTRPRSLKR
jgi:(+)-pinoresinol hydroxylase